MRKVEAPDLEVEFLPSNYTAEDGVSDMRVRATSKKRLENFVEGIVFGRIPGDDSGTINDEFLVRGAKDEKTDVVTAVNHGEFWCSYARGI